MNCVMRRDDKPCESEATHIVLSPWGSTRDVCAEHAEAYARAEGFRVGPREAFCASCLQLKPLEIGFWCWCGARATARHQVAGMWYALCDIHKPPRLWDLWKRFFGSVWWRLTHFWRRPALPQPLVNRRLERKR